MSGVLSGDDRGWFSTVNEVRGVRSRDGCRGLVIQALQTSILAGPTADRFASCGRQWSAGGAFEDVRREGVGVDASLRPVGEIVDQAFDGSVVRTAEDDTVDD